jgi:hypothetical protein
MIHPAGIVTIATGKCHSSGRPEHQAGNTDIQEEPRSVSGAGQSKRQPRQYQGID